MQPTFPIDFNAIRASLVGVVQQATGLDQNHVVMQEAESVVSARPTLPYITLKFTTVASSMGDDVFTPAGSDDDCIFNYGGQRMCSVAFDCFGRSHEEAYNYLHLLMSRLEQEPTQDALDDAGLTIWDYGSVVDMTALLSTGFEGRAHMDCTFGLASNMLVDLGRIDSVNVTGTIDTFGATPVVVSITAPVKGD